MVKPSVYAGISARHHQCTALREKKSHAERRLARGSGDQGQRQQAEGGEEEHGDLPADGVVHDEGEPAADQVKKPRLRFCVQ